MPWEDVCRIVEAFNHAPALARCWQVMEIQQRYRGEWVVSMFRFERPARSVMVTSWDGWGEFRQMAEAEASPVGLWG